MIVDVRDEFKKLFEAYRSEKPDNNEINIKNLRLTEALVKNLSYT